MYVCTIINVNRHASHRNGFISATGIHQRRFDNQMPPDSPEPWTAMSGVRCLKPITSSINQINHRTQTSVAGDLGQPATGTDQQGSCAPHYDCRDAQKLTVNNNWSTQSDCQTSDTVFTVSFQLRCFAVLLLFLNNGILQWYVMQTFFSARKSSLSGHAISIISSYVNIIKCHLALTCRTVYYSHVNA